MFITVKRHQREKQELLSVNNRLTEAVLQSSGPSLFLLDSRNRVLPPVSRSLMVLFRRQDFTQLTLEKLVAPIVSAKTLTVFRNHMATLLGASQRDAPPAENPFSDIEVRLPNPDGSVETAHFAFEFDPVIIPDEPGLWLVRVTDMTARVQTMHELEELRTQHKAQGEILGGVLKMGGASFAAFMLKTDASMKAIAAVLKKPARATEAFRQKLEETLAEVDRIRRDAAAFKLSDLESAARLFEDSVHELRSRKTLSGGDFLPLAVKLDNLYNQFATIKSLTAAAIPGGDGQDASGGSRVTDNGTQIIEAPTFAAEAAQFRGKPGASRTAPAGSLDSTLQALTEHVAQQYDKQVLLEISGLQLVPPKLQAVVKNIAIQLIRNAVMHGIEPAIRREAAGKPLRGTMRLEFKSRGGAFEFLFEDDGCGLDPDQVRATAVACGILTAEAASRIRDREAIKLIFKSRFTTLPAGDGAAHGAGMSLVRRYVHEAGGKVSLASLPGHETRFKITLPSTPASDAHVA